MKRTVSPIPSALFDGDAATAVPSVRDKQATTDVASLIDAYRAKVVTQYAAYLANGQYNQANELAFEAMAFDEGSDAASGERLMDELRAIGRTSAFGVAA